MPDLEPCSKKRAKPLCFSGSLAIRRDGNSIDEMTNGTIFIAPFGEEFAGEKGFFYSINVQGQGRGAVLSRSVPYAAGLDAAADCCRRRLLDNRRAVLYIIAYIFGALTWMQ
jgi:hypothetical protein